MQGGDFIGCLVDAQAGDVAFAVDDRQARIGRDQRVMYEDAHHLAFDRQRLQRHMGGEGGEGIAIAVLIAPIEHLALKPQKVEGAQFKIGHDGGGGAGDRDDDQQRAFMGMETVAGEAFEIGTGHQRHGLGAEAFGHAAVFGISVHGVLGGDRLAGPPRGTAPACLAITLRG